MVDDLIKRQYAIDAIENITWYHQNANKDMICGANSEEHQAWYKVEDVYKALNCIPSAQPERLTDDDFETIRIHLNAYKEKLCNQQRWGEADEYQRILDRFMAFASAQPEPKWIPCSERLPEEGQEILATTTDNAWGDVVIIRTYYKEMHKSVIAWMPLPEPYREEGNE